MSNAPKSGSCWRARLAKIDRCPVCGAWRYAGRCPAAAYANHRRTD